MKRITLNSQGILDIQDPRKLYIMKSFRHDEPDNITYSTPYEICKNEWFFVKMSLTQFKACPTDTYFVVSRRPRYLQYLLELSLTNNTNASDFIDELYQFDSMEEFQNCYKEGAI